MWEESGGFSQDSVENCVSSSVDPVGQILFGLLCCAIKEMQQV